MTLLQKFTYKHRVLQAQGCALFDLTAQPDGKLYSASLLVLRPRRGQTRLSPHILSKGDNVLISTGRPAEDATNGVVAEVGASWIRVVVSKFDAGAILGPGFRLDLAANTVAYDRVTLAIKAFSNAPDADLPAHNLWRCALRLASG